MRRIWGPLISHRSSKASTTNAIVCVSWNERLFLGRSKCRPSRDGRPTTCLRGLKCCLLPSRSSLLGDYRGLDVASIDPFESTTITRNFEETFVRNPDMINVHFISLYIGGKFVERRKRKRNGGRRVRLEFHNATNTIAYRYRLSFGSVVGPRRERTRIGGEIRKGV